MNRRKGLQHQNPSAGNTAIATHRNNFDFLRLSAALMVLFSHSWAVVGKGLDQPVLTVTGGHILASDAGLAIFFTISGFLVMKSFFRSSVISYIIKRLLRILPALVIANLFCIVLGAFISNLHVSDYFSHSQTWKFLLINSSLIKNTYSLPGVFSNNITSSVNSSLWTIPLEFKLYILLAVAGIAGLYKNSKITIVLFGIWCLVFLLMVNGLIDPGPLTNYFGLGLYFFAGLMMAIFEKNIPFKWQYVVVLLLLAILFRNTFLHQFTALLFLSYTCICFGRSRQVISLGNIDISYGTYLYAYPIQQTLVLLFGSGMNPGIHFLLSTILTVPLAFLSWKYIEEPALKRKTRLGFV